MRLLQFIFFCSGAAALIFEQLWFRQTGLLLGNTVTTASLVLAAFMGGLALGNGLALAIRNRLNWPLRWVAVLEIAIALSGIALVYGLPLLPELLSAWANAPAVRFLIAFFLLLLPATAMGLSLPVLVHAATPVAGSFAVSLGRLYGWNTIGAVFGVLVAEVYLVPRWGLHGSAGFAAGLDVFAAILACSIASRFPSVKAEKPSAAITEPSLKPARGLWLVAAFSGFAVLALEVVWFRLLLQFNRGTALAFACMLAIVLTGIGLGGVLAARLLQRQALPSPAALAGGLGLAVLLGYACLHPFWFSGWLSGTPELLPLMLMGSALILPATLISGMLFTALGEAMHDPSQSPLQTTGLLAMTNTAGAALGALAGGLLLLPLLGVESTLMMLAIGLCLVAVVIGRLQLKQALALWVLLPTIFIVLLWGRDDRLHEIPARYYQANDQAQQVLIREGVDQTVQLLRSDFLDEPLHWRLVTNGYSMSNTAADSRRYMQLFVWVPAVLTAKIDDALLISYGVGSTAQALTSLDEIRRIDVVDPAADILALSREIHGAGDPLTDPRVNVIQQDGRFHLQTTARQYDLITGEPPPPRLAGIVNLYTQEYFRLMQARLKPGGVASYWLPVDQLTLESTGTIMAAFCAEFADCSLWAGSHYNWILLGSRPGGADFNRVQRFQELAATPLRRELLAETGLENPAQLGATFIADADTLKQWIDGAAVLTDDQPYRLALASPDRKTFKHYAKWQDADAARYRFTASAWVRMNWPEQLREATADAFLWQPVLNGQTSRDPGRRMAILDRLLQHSNLRTPVLWLLDSSVTHQKILRSRPEVSNQSDFRYHLGVGALANRDYAVAEKVLGELAENDAAVLDVFLLASCRAHRPADEACDELRPEVPDLRGFEHP